MIKKIVSNALFGRFFAGFSLIELMISLIIISMIAASFAPVITKKLSSNSIVSSASKSISSIRSDCDDFNQEGGVCSVCTDSFCLSCTLDNCDESQGKYKNVGKCACESCTLRDENCANCNSKACTKCKENYYLDDSSKCASCPNGKYCDGSTNSMDCTKINSNCVACSSTSTCTKCNSGYYLNSTKTSCTKCEAGNYCNGQTKTACADKTYSSSGASSCSAVTDVANCMTYYKDKNACKTCNNGYYMNGSSCTYCPAGYYCKDNNKTACTGTTYSTGGASSCSNSTNSANCTTIDNKTGKCTKCNNYYKVSNGKCVANFTCSGAYFLKIGSLCVTKYNMGDSTDTAIPSGSATVVSVPTTCGSNTDYSTKCCWKGATAGTSCNNTNGDYSGCNRTVCNWAAANAICANYKLGGKSWRLATTSEMSNWLDYSKSKGNNGLMLCDVYSDYATSTYCRGQKYCAGANTSGCSPSCAWAAEVYDSERASFSCLSTGYWSQYWMSYRTAAYSVRCVTTM